MLNTKQRKATTYFIGTEVEHTIMKGKKTLFVVGIQPATDILVKAEENDIKHIYFGTSQSFNPVTPEDWRDWDDMIKPILQRGDMFVTLDFDVKYAADIHEDGWTEFNNFIAMISCKIPYIKLHNYHATIKIDDTTWGATNSGVWSTSLHNVMRDEYYTPWHAYEGDEPV